MQKTREGVKVVQIMADQKLIDEVGKYIGHCAIGYAAAPANAPAPRKDNYVYYVR